MHVIEIDFCDRRGAQALRALPFLTFLDSAMADRKLGRYSFIAADPFARSSLAWRGRLGRAPKIQLAAYRTASLPGLPLFKEAPPGCSPTSLAAVWNACHSPQ